MNIGIQTFGSEGDVRPLIALGQELKQHGHNVQVVISSIDNKDYGLLFSKTGIEIKTVPQYISITQKRIREIARMKNLIKALKATFRETFTPYADEMYAEALRLCNECDIVISHFSVYPMSAAARKTGKPHISICFWPGMIPAEDRPLDGTNKFSLLINGMVSRLMQIMFDLLLRNEMKPIWMKNGMSAPPHVISDMWLSKYLTIVASSPSIWGKTCSKQINVKTCGFFDFQNEKLPEHIPENIRQFIMSGEPPVYITFGSMFQIYPEEITSFISGVVGDSSHRYIIQTDQNFEIPPQRHLLNIHRCEHSLVFPRCRAVIHHGGAGTVQASCVAACPSLVIAFNDEQYSWGKQLHSLGISPMPMRFRKRNSKSIKHRIAELFNSDTMKNNAIDFSRQMRKENGIRQAVREIELIIG